MMYIQTLSNFREFEEILEPNKKYRMAYTKEAVCTYYLLIRCVYSTIQFLSWKIYT
jgi:eudesmane-5,11-diol synthase